MVSPIHLVPRVLRHAKICNSVGTLIVPLWKSAPFWPMLCPDGILLAEYVNEVLYLEYQEDLVMMGLSGSYLFKGKLDHAKMLALRLNFIK